jgi:hypothetical protein
MSHYTVMETQLSSAEHLVKALNDLGFENVEVHAEPQRLVGWLGDDRTNRAHVIVRKREIGFVSNDIGFLQTPSGYFKAQISDFDRLKFDEEWLRALTQRYAYHVAKDMLAEQDFEAIEESRETDGTIHLTVRRMG